MHINHAGLGTRAVVIVVMTYLVIMLLNVMGQIQETQAVGETLQAEVDAMKEANDKMAHALEYNDDPEMLEQVARERGYIKVGETLYLDIAG